jgi:hypothetical protein
VSLEKSAKYIATARAAFSATSAMIASFSLRFMVSLYTLVLVVE